MSEVSLALHIDIKKWAHQADCKILQIESVGRVVTLHFADKATTGALWIDDVSIVVDSKDAMKNGELEDKR